MAWGLVLIAVAVVIGWRRPKVDGVAILGMILTTALVLAYTYRSLGS